MALCTTAAGSFSVFRFNSTFRNETQGCSENITLSCRASRRVAVALVPPEHRASRVFVKQAHALFLSDSCQTLDAAFHVGIREALFFVASLRPTETSVCEALLALLTCSLYNNQYL